MILLHNEDNDNLFLGSSLDSHLTFRMDGVEPQFFAIEALVTGPLLQLDPNSKGLYSSLATNPTPSLPITVCKGN